MKKLFIPIFVGLSAMALLTGCRDLKSGGGTSAESQKLATAIVNTDEMQVPLAPFFNNAGIAKDDASVAEGLDNQGFACSATLLGKSRCGMG
jgi:hypothetical protein